MNIDRIYEANARLNGHVRRTPLLSSPFLDTLAGRKIYVKAECLQHTGSFKFRGAWSAVSALKGAGNTQGIAAVSSGNHAQAIAYAAKAHNYPATIIMPADAPEIKIENTRALGAKVVLYDRARENRDDIAADICAAHGLHLIKPFDNLDVIAGQGTTGLEIAQQAADHDIHAAQVLVCCGGGGLTSGIALALEHAAPDFSVHPVEPEHYDDVARSLISGNIETNASTARSLCDAIITPSPGEITFPIMQRLCPSGFVIPESDCLRAMAQAWLRLKIVLEPGGAIALAAALYHPHLFDNEVIICVASGGNVDRDVFESALQHACN